ncbi:putative surface protease GP63 [Trypanosoma cruzi]|uniref:Leishmanolysin-like peptidase n=1 Tax=Trypanosoma cruzi TaxID=5693 RepID=A0A2V2XGA1_TRYCR|nr:putative surface protease GP63 [Trypanosoma cruzi]
MQFTQVMRQQRHDTPLFPLAVLLLMCCASGCVAAAPATQYRCGFDVVMRRSGRLPTAVVREVPRKGQGAMQAYTVATQDDDSGWEPIRMAASTEDLERGTNKRKKYCEEGEDECYNALGQRVSCKAEHFLTEAKKQLCTGKILPGAVKVHAERLLVKPTGGTITVPRAMNGPCSHFMVPTRHKSDGVPNADFIIYAAARPSGTDSRAVWAATCNTLTDFCPSIGAMNFDQKYLTDTAWSVRVAAHEIAHALWFSQECMEKKSLVKKRERSVRGTHRRMVAGNHVQEKTKAHFGCETLEGMVLEDEDGPREKEIPHWKGRHARDELMAPAVGAGYYTALTMAVFADMGYYRVNWNMAKPMSWGHRSACDFLVKKCNTTDNLAAKYPQMFCDATDTETLRCTSDRRHVGMCTASIVEGKGSLVDKDVCPVVSLEFHEISSGTTYRTCSDENVDYLRGSLTGGGSWCLDAELLETKDGDGHKSVKGVCAQVSCEEGTVRMRHLGSSGFQPCPEDTDIPVTLKYFQKDGKIKCPTYGEVCTIAANGSSLVVPSALVGRQGDEQEEEAEESAVASGSPSPENTRPQLSPVASGASIEKEPPGASAAGVAGGGLHAGPRGDPGCGPKVGTTLSGEGGDLAVEAREPTEPPAPTLFFFLRHHPARTLHERRATRGRIAQRWFPVSPRLPLRFRPSTATIFR